MEISETNQIGNNMDIIFGILAYLLVGILVTSLWRRFTDSNDTDAPEVLVIFVIAWPFISVGIVSYRLVLCFSNFLQRWPKRSNKSR